MHGTRNATGKNWEWWMWIRLSKTFQRTLPFFKEGRHKSPTLLSRIISGPVQLIWKMLIHIWNYEIIKISFGKTVVLDLWFIFLTDPQTCLVTLKAYDDLGSGQPAQDGMNSGQWCFLPCRVAYCTKSHREWSAAAAAPWEPVTETGVISKPVSYMK